MQYKISNTGTLSNLHCRMNIESTTLNTESKKGGTPSNQQDEGTVKQKFVALQNVLLQWSNFKVMKHLITLTKPMSDLSNQFFNTCKQLFLYTRKHTLLMGMLHSFAGVFPGKEGGIQSVQLHLDKQTDNLLTCEANQKNDSTKLSCTVVQHCSI